MRLRGQWLSASFGRSRVSITSKKPHGLRASCWSAGGRSGAVRALAPAPPHGRASCTRFSPNTLWPAASTAATRSQGCCFETAVSVTAERVAPRGQRRAAMRARIAGPRVGGVDRRGELSLAWVTVCGCLWRVGSKAKAGGGPGKGPAAAAVLHRPGAHADPEP